MTLFAKDKPTIQLSKWLVISGHVNRLSLTKFNCHVSAISWLQSIPFLVFLHLFFFISSLLTAPIIVMFNQLTDIISVSYWLELYLLFSFCNGSDFYSSNAGFSQQWKKCKNNVIIFLQSLCSFSLCVVCVCVHVDLSQNKYLAVEMQVISRRKVNFGETQEDNWHGLIAL